MKACFQIPECSLSYAKIVQTSGKKACFHFPECSLSYAKIAQTSGKKACFHFPECSLSYAKIVQTSGKKACFHFPECSLSYAKIAQTSGKKACFHFPECSLSYAKIQKCFIQPTPYYIIIQSRENKKNGCRAPPLSDKHTSGNHLPLLRPTVSATLRRYPDKTMATMASHKTLTSLKSEEYIRYAIKYSQICGNIA